jgi:hypothetical protein
MNKMPEIITLKEACAILKISLGYGYQIWPSWRDYGVRILKMRPNARPRFYVEDIIRMLEKRK